MIPAPSPSLEGVFTPYEAATLRAALDRIIPADDYPSACEAGVDSYLARQFQNDLADRLATYQAGLEHLDRDAKERYGAEFAALDSGQQDAIFASAEQNPDSSAFIAMLIAHAAEGYYGDPGNGGNRDCSAWKMVGFDPRWTIGEETVRP